MSAWVYESERVYKDTEVNHYDVTTRVKGLSGRLQEIPLERLPGMRIMDIIE